MNSIVHKCKSILFNCSKGMKLMYIHLHLFETGWIQFVHYFPNQYSIPSSPFILTSFSNSFQSFQTPFQSIHTSDFQPFSPSHSIPVLIHNSNQYSTQSNSLPISQILHQIETRSSNQIAHCAFSFSLSFPSQNITNNEVGFCVLVGMNLS